MSIILSSDPENKELSRIIYIVDAVILLQYILEFSVRVWVVGCNAKYRGVRSGLLERVVPIVKPLL